MDESIKEYAEAVKNYIELSQQETAIKIKIQNARARLRMAKDALREKEEEMLELKY